MRHPVVSTTGLISLLLLAAGCGSSESPSGPGTPTATTVSVSPDAVTLSSLSETRQLGASVLDQSGSPMAGQSVVWSTSAPGVVGVSGAGLATAMGNGSALVVATSGTLADTANVTVNQAVSTVLASVDTLRLAGPGAEGTITAAVRDALGFTIAGAPRTWTEEDAGVATVDGSGTVTAVAAGQTRVFVASTAGGQTRADTIRVEVASMSMTVDDFCGNFAPDAVPPFASTRLANEVRARLGLAAQDPMTCALVATVDSLFIAPQVPFVTDLRGAQNLVGLDSLWINGHGVSNVSPLADLPELRYLSASNTNVADVSPLATVTTLEFLGVSGNGVSDISMLSGLTAMKQLGIGNNPIGDIGVVANMPGLVQLSAGYSGISDVSPLATLTGLQFLYINNNAISNLTPLQGLVNLEELWLKENPITDISALSGLSKLVEFQLENTGISDITGIGGMTSLEDVHIERNAISDLTPLTGLVTITNLVLDGQSVALTDISPLGGLVNLTVLDLSTNNSLTNIQPLIDNTGLGSGDSVNLVFTGVSCANVNLLRAKGVTVTALNCPP